MPAFRDVPPDGSQRGGHSGVPSAFNTSQSGGFYSRVTVQTPSKGCPSPARTSLDRTPQVPTERGLWAHAWPVGLFWQKPRAARPGDQTTISFVLPTSSSSRMNLAFREQRNANRQVPGATGEAFKTATNCGTAMHWREGLSYIPTSPNSSQNHPVTHPTSSLCASP